MWGWTVTTSVPRGSQATIHITFILVSPYVTSWSPSSCVVYCGPLQVTFSDQDSCTDPTVAVWMNCLPLRLPCTAQPSSLESPSFLEMPLLVTCEISCLGCWVRGYVHGGYASLLSPGLIQLSPHPTEAMLNVHMTLLTDSDWTSQAQYRLSTQMRDKLTLKQLDCSHPHFLLRGSNLWN